MGMAFSVAGWHGALAAVLTGLAGITAALHFRQSGKEAARRAEDIERERVVLAEAQSFSHTGTWEVDLATGLGTWSDEMYLICGLEPPAGARGREDILRVIHPQDRHKLLKATERVVKDLLPFQVAHRVLWPDGTVRSCVSRGKVTCGTDGRPVSMTGATQDVTDQARMEESLRDAEARFLAFMDHSPFSAWMRDSSGQFIYSNERFAEFMGIQPHEIVGLEPNASWLTREYVEKSLRDDQRVLALGRSSENIEHVPLRDGSLRHWLVLKFPIKSQSGETFVGGVSLDLTGRYEADEKLRASEKRLRSVMQYASEGIAAADAEGRIISWNPAAEKIFGYSEEEMLGRPLTMLLIEGDQAGDDTEGRALILRGRRKSGEEFALEFSRSSWRSGTQTYVTAILRDVTERKKIEEQLRLSEAHMRITLDAALDAVPQIVWTAQPDGVFSFFNRKWFEYAGVSFPQQSEQGWLAWVHPEDLPKTSAVWREALRKGESCEMEYRLRRGTDGNYRWHIGRALPVRNASGGVVVQWFGTSTDIHDHRMAQEEQSQLRAREAAALETSRLKSEFLAHMSHEIRTPINGVIGMTGLLLDTSLDKDQHLYADAIHRSAETLLDIINDILDFSKIEAGKLDIEQIDFELARAFDDTEKTLHYQARAKGLRLHFEMGAGAPVLLRGDPGRLKQVLGNLTANAIKFTAKGSVVVKACLDTAAESAGGAVWLRFEVTDTGIGISAQSRDRLFEPFSQADSSTSRRFGGTGLGLSICKRLVARMGGQIGVSSVEGQGSTFWFTLPFTVSGMSAVAIGNSRPGILPQLGRRARVLVAEDNLINQTIFLKQLEKMELRVDAVANGHEVLAALREVPYDLILMDCQMPEMDGYEATSRIRAEVAATYRSIPIVAVTANAIKGDREKCLALGMNDYIAKPVHADELGRILAKWLKPSEGGASVSSNQSHATATTDPAIHLEIIEELRQLDDGKGDVLRQLINMFVDGGPERIATLERAQAAGDLKTMNSEAHTFKSSSANLGANRMAALCYQLEQARTPDLAVAVAEVPRQLRVEFERARKELLAVAGKGSVA